MNLRLRPIAIVLLLTGCNASKESESDGGSGGPDAEPSSGDAGNDVGTEVGHGSDAMPSAPVDASAPAAPRADAARPGPQPDAFRPVPDPLSATIAAPAGPLEVRDIVDLRPLETLDGSTYRWTLVDRPAGSSTRPVEALGNDRRSPFTHAVEDDPATPSAVLYLDRVGTYTVALEVTALDGRQVEATATLDVTPATGVYLELTWETPGDPIPSDNAGSDVDLHLLHPGGHWQLTPPDCFYANPNPDWGAADEPRDNPQLVLDDNDGDGPEIIELEAPEHTEDLGDVYRVGVHYYREEARDSFEGYGPSLATVQVHLGGTLAWVNEVPRELVRTGAFWTVGEILWTRAEHRFRLVDRMDDRSPAVP